MTISTSVGRQFTVSEIILAAYRLAGLVDEGYSTADVGWVAKSNEGRIQLELIMDALQNHGVFARSVSFYKLTLVAGTWQYSMPAGTLDVFGTAAYMDASVVDTEKADGETLVQPWTRNDWHSCSAHGSTGRVTQYYAHRELDAPAVWLWPIPDEAGTIRFQIHRDLADTDDATATLDLRNYWVKHVTYELAATLARMASLPVGLVNSLAQVAAKEKGSAESMAHESPSFSITVSHGQGSQRF